MDKENIKDLLEVRKILESGTAELAAKKRTAEDIAEMETKSLRKC